ncbi:MAG: transglutaminase domain-containing protein [Lachnospiraceae bacterium]
MQQDSLQKASEIADEIIKDGMSDYEKELAINQYLCEHASYNKEIMDYISEAGTIDEEAVKKFSNSFTPYGILVENLGVCESYSEAFQLVARAAGLDSIIVTGQLDGVNHEWNRVKLDESWYTLDVTNNDNEVISNALFNLSDDTAKEILLQSTDALMDEFIGNYTASDMDHEYYTMSGLYTEDADEAAKKLAEALDADGKAAVRMDSSLGGESVDTIVQKSVDQSGVDSARYYQFANVIVLTKE